MANARLVSSAASLSDSALVKRLERGVAHGRRVDAQIIRLLGEVDARRLYREHACSSLFRFCTERLGMSEGAAYKRITVARASRKVPGILAALESGDVHLAGLTCLCPHLSAENANELLERAAGKSKRQIEVLVRALAPKPDVRAQVRRVAEPGVAKDPPQQASLLAPATDHNGTEGLPGPQQELAPATGVSTAVGHPVPGPGPKRNAVMTPLSPARYRVSVTVSEAVKDNLERARELARPGVSMESLFERAMELLVSELATKRLGVPGRKSPKTKNNPRSRYIVKAVKREVSQRDDGQCTYVDGRGRRCSERRGLEFDHIVPHAQGGTSVADNLRLRCRAHNQLHAEECFGPLFVAEKRVLGSTVRSACDLQER